MVAAVPFHSAYEALQWAAAGMAARRAGARVFAGGGDVPRPCEVLDVANVLDRLVKAGRIGSGVAKVMIVSAQRGDALPPAARKGMAELGRALAAKGIVAKGIVEGERDHD